MTAEAPSAARPSRRRWGLRFAVFGGALILLGAAGWLFRIPIAEFTFRSVLAQRGIEADGDILSLSLNSVLARRLRLGPANAPDATIDMAQLRWRWAGLTPTLTTVRLVEPRLHIRFDAAGRLSAGTLDRLQAGAPAPSVRPGLATGLRLDIGGGRALVDAPLGPVLVQFEGTGVLGRDFRAAAWVAPTSSASGAYALDNGHAELQLRSEHSTLIAQLTASVDRLAWSDLNLNNAALLVTARAPLDLARAEAELGWQVAALSGAHAVAARRFDGRITAQATMRADTLAPETWTGALLAHGGLLAQGGMRLAGARIEAQVQSRHGAARGAWTLTGARFDGLALVAPSPRAEGDVAFAATQLDVRGRISVAHARIDGRAQADMRRALPEMDGAPVGPVFAQARRALDAAADNFSLALPFTLHWRDDQGSVEITAPVEAQAATGALVRVTPLRDDTPAVSAQLPRANVHGVVSVDLHGGGLPTANLLFDSIDWAPDAPLEADGSLTITDWRAGDASIATPSLDLSLEAPGQGEHRLDIKGPATISGPLGDGAVRDMTADLDIALSWNQGWRITPTHQCVPVTLGALNVAGLAFQGGAFRLCAAQSGVLIAADAAERLSGGFLIQALDLNGRMAPPDSQPARLRSGAVRGVFSGASHDIALDIEAVAPNLAIAMATDRMLSVRGDHITANARITDSGWRVDGAFVSGLLSDPTLPGDVSAIAGRWSAAPQDDRAVIRVDAGEARIIAHPPPPNAADNRLPFNPIRLADVSALVDAGDITANGRIVLEKGAHPLARFTAEHHIDAGEGAAHVTADDIVFDQTFQPYEITELARGLVDNVRGSASATADFTWTRDTLSATGHVRPNGLSLAMATIPVIQDVRGDVFFDNLLTLTTPPGQALTVGMINPGIEVHNGRLRFQLLPDERVAIEQAEFDFAAGTLAVAPTTIALGAEETRFELTLQDVDVETLLTQMDFPDLKATGRIEGSFPLLLTRRTAVIQNGVLRAEPGGGSISYVGSAGQNAGGAAGVAFDALKSFHYDNLNLTLNGDISGDVITSVRFTGFNTGHAIDLGPISPVPGVGQLHARGVPFRFNVTVTAPFRRLMEAAATVTNPQSLLHQAEPGAPPVDQQPPAPR